MNAPATRPQSALPSLAMEEHELIAVLENSLYPGAGSTSISLVINYCKAAGLDPMQKPVHIVPIWDSKAGRMRDVVMPGIGLYRTQAARSGAYAGVTDPEFGPDVTEKIGGQEITYPSWCRVSIKRRLPSGEIVEFAAVERWKENYAQKGGKEKSIAPNAMWSRRPYAQLAKCAEAQALRKAFPEFGAAPTADEMEGKAIDDYQAGNTIDGSTGEIVQPKTLPAYSNADFEKNLPAWHELIASGKKTAERIISTIETKATLTDEQKNRISAPQQEPAPMSYAYVAEKMNNAQTIEDLLAAYDLAREINDEGQQTELGLLYEQLYKKFDA